MLTNKEYYKKNGYVIIPNLIEEKYIDNILFQLEKFKKNNSLFYSQSDHNWRRIKNDLDKNGLLTSSFENFTNLVWSKKLARSGRDILQSKPILEILRELSDQEDFCMWQNMLFDRSTGTVDHLDTWYLDTDPMGKLIASWVALEDINDDGGSFHIYPGSHLENSNDWIGTNHEKYVLWCNELSKKYIRKKALLKKGDVLFWHPSLLHGATLQNKKGKTRKSLTAHYFPTNYLKGGGGKNSNFESKEYQNELIKQNNKIRTFGYPISADSSRRDCLIFSAKGVLKYLLNINKRKMLMNRKNYSLK